MFRKNRVLYLISRENVLEPGVLKSQVLDLLGQVTKERIGTEILILDFPSLHKFLKYFRNYRSVNRYARNLGIKLIIIPILPIGRSFMPVWAIPFFLIQTIPFVIFYSIFYRADIIHARSYLSALICLALKYMGIGKKFIFDMRGLYLLEGVISSRWEKSDLSFKIWSWFEKILFSTSDWIISQSSFMEGYARKTSPDARILTIPCCVDIRKFSLPNSERKKRRAEFGISDKFVVAYLGSLGSFHDPKFIANSYSLLKRYLPNPYLLVVSHSDFSPLVKALSKLKISDKDFTLTHSPKDVEKIVPLGDVGLHVFDDLSITPSVVSVKLGEYLSSGLPVIVTHNLTSIKKLVDDYHCGVVVDMTDTEDIRSKMQELVRNRGGMGKNALKLARDYFSVKVCARKYLEVYKDILEDGSSKREAGYRGEII